MEAFGKILAKLCVHLFKQVAAWILTELLEAILRPLFAPMLKTVTKRTKRRVGRVQKAYKSFQEGWYHEPIGATV